MLVELILILITLGAAIVGTLTNGTRSVKAVIISLAVAASIASIYKAHDDARDKDFIKSALAAQLSSSKPTRAFDREFDEAAGRVAAKYGLTTGDIVSKDRGETVYFLNKKTTGVLGGVAVIGPEERGEVFVRYVAKRPMDEFIEDRIFKRQDINGKNFAGQVVDDLEIIAWIAIDQNVSWVTPDTDITRSTSTAPLKIEVKAQNGNGPVANVQFAPEFIDSTLSLAPFERNLKAYGEAQSQLTGKK